MEIKNFKACAQFAISKIFVIKEKVSISKIKTSLAKKIGANEGRSSTRQI